MTADPGDKIPPHLKDKINPVKNRILFLSPSVLAGEEREARKEDFESQSNANIGQGGFGKVYKVKHKASKNIYAIKVINKAKVLENELAEQMKLEVKIMYQLNHPHIIKLYNHFEDEDNFYLVLEFASKGQLYTRLKMLGRLDERQTAQYIREVVSAVEYLHSLKPPIIHRDIKPENILLDSNEAAKLCDFGWSNFDNPDRKRTTYCGTPEYLAPEMIKQTGHDESLDFWNIGVLTFELLTGKPPFEGATQKDLFESILKIRITYPKDFPKLAKDLVARLLKPDPKDRIKMKELSEHAWFRSLAPLRPVIGRPPEQSGTPSPAVYEVMSKKSATSLQDDRGKMQDGLRIDGVPVGEKKKDEKDKIIEELSNKQQALTKVLGETKTALEIRTKELENLRKEVQNSKSLSGSAEKGYIPETTLEIRRLNDELQKLKMLNKTREDALAQLEQKTLLLTEHETKLKLLQNELEIERNGKEMLTAKLTELQEKEESNDKRFETQRQAFEEFKVQKEKQVAELESKLEVLQKKLIAKTEETTQDSGDTMVELIKSILEEIRDKIATQVRSKKEEQQLREELISANNKLAALKSKHDNEVFELQTQHAKKVDELKVQAKTELAALASKETRKLEALHKQLQEANSKTTQAEIHQSTEKSMKDVMEQQQRLMADMKKKIEMHEQEEAILRNQTKALSVQIGDLEYQYAVLKDKAYRTQELVESSYVPTKP